jgi:glucose/mannose-6-phosphate isomerase
MDLLDIIHSLPQQIREGVQLGKDVKISGDFSNIVVTGMGGSGIPGDLLKAVLRDCKIPIIVNKDYSLPGFVNKNTLVFVISYSGNTEETVSAFKEAQKKRATIVVLTSGGKIRELARDAKAPMIIVPQGIPPRNAVAYLLFPIMVILHNAGITKLNPAEIKETIDSLKNSEFGSKAKELAGHLKGKIPIIYSGPQHEAVALRWKQEFNENSKVHAFYNVFSELDHNEITAYQNAKDNFHIILLRDERENAQNRKRMDHLKQLVKDRKIPITEIMLKGLNPLVKIFTALYMGDLTSYYLAQNYGVDPIDTHIIEDLKKKL